MGCDGELLAVRSPPAKREVEKGWVTAMIQGLGFETSNATTTVPTASVGSKLTLPNEGWRLAERVSSGQRVRKPTEPNPKSIY